MKLLLPGGLIIAAVVTAGIAVAEMIRRSHGVPSLAKLISVLTLLGLIYERGRSFRNLEKDAFKIAPDPIQRKRFIDQSALDAIFVIFAYQVVMWVGIAFAQR